MSNDRAFLSPHNERKFIINHKNSILYNNIHEIYSPYHQLRAVQVPDIDPFELPMDGRFSMAAGDFLEIYSEPGE